MGQVGDLQRNLEIYLMHDSWICRRGCFTQGAGEARLRSSQTGSSLLNMLRGKSPCLWAESVSGRPQGSSHGFGGEALSGATKPGLDQLQQHRHAVSACLRRQLNGAHSPHALFHVAILCLLGHSRASCTETGCLTASGASWRSSAQLGNIFNA